MDKERSGETETHQPQRKKMTRMEKGLVTSPNTGNRDAWILRYDDVDVDAGIPDTSGITITTR